MGKKIKSKVIARRLKLRKKTCSKCKIEKKFDCFGVKSKNSDGHRYWCKKCTAKSRYEKRHSMPDPVAERESFYEWRYELIKKIGKKYTKKEDLPEPEFFPSEEDMEGEENDRDVEYAKKMLGL